jgi:hypothetical protein
MKVCPENCVMMHSNAMEKLVYLLEIVLVAKNCQAVAHGASILSA